MEETTAEEMEILKPSREASHRINKEFRVLKASLEKEYPTIKVEYYRVMRAVAYQAFLEYLDRGELSNLVHRAQSNFEYLPKKWSASLSATPADSQDKAVQQTPADSQDKAVQQTLAARRCRRNPRK